MKNENPVILALYPNAIGVGYACLQVPDKVIDFGVTSVRPFTNRKLLRRVEKFLDHYKPELVLLKDEQAKNGRRILQLVNAISNLASEKNLKVYKYTKDQVRDVFEIFGVKTKNETVEKIVSMLPDLECRKPRQRFWYEKQDYNMALFDAVALAITHVHLTE